MSGQPQLSNESQRSDAARKAGIAVVVNGEPRELAAGLTLAEALPALGAPKVGFAVERNGALVPKSLHAETRLEEGDRLEIVAFVGGG